MSIISAPRTSCAASFTVTAALHPAFCEHFRNARAKNGFSRVATSFDHLQLENSNRAAVEGIQHLSEQQPALDAKHQALLRCARKPSLQLGVKAQHQATLQCRPQSPFWLACRRGCCCMPPCVC